MWIVMKLKQDLPVQYAPPLSWVSAESVPVRHKLGNCGSISRIVRIPAAKSFHERMLSSTQAIDPEYVLAFPMAAGYEYGMCQHKRENELGAESLYELWPG